MIDWLIEQATTHSSHLFGYFQISQFEEVQQQSFQVQKKPEQKTDLLYYKSRSFLACFLHVMTWRKQENFRREKPELHAGCCMGGQRRPIIHAKAKGVLSTQLLTPLLQVSLLSLSLSLSTTHLASRSSVGLFFTSDLQVRWDDVHAKINK